MLCLVGASLMASLDADRKAGLGVIEHFTEKDMDNFEKCDDEHKIMVLGEIFMHLEAGYERRESAKKGLALMKSCSLPPSRKGKQVEVQFWSSLSRNTEVDVLLQQEKLKLTRRK